MKRTMALFVALLPLAAMAQSIKSPDGSHCFNYFAESNSYSVDFNGKPLIVSGEFGPEIDNRLFESALAIPNGDYAWTFDGCDTSSHSGSWKPVYGENATINDNYNEMTIHLSKGGEKNVAAGYSFDKRQFYNLDIIVRAYNEGVAFRYSFPQQSNGLFINIIGENTTFTLPAGTMAWCSEWAQGPFRYRALLDWKDEIERPALLKLQDGRWAAILEASLTNFVRGKFMLASDNTLKVKLYDGAEIISPYSTPWRVIMGGEKAIDLINHKDIILNLNEPCAIERPSWIKPGKAFRVGNLSKQPIMEGIKFAKEMNFRYIELDAGWYGPEMSMESSALKVAETRDFTLEEVCDSASAAGIGVWLYVNQRALYRELDQILPYFKNLGVKGIKFGFVQVGNQYWTTWLHDAVKKCADYGLMVDIHDEYRPTGVSRTFPNLLTQEGIRGNEEMPDALNNTLLPFSRFLCGPGDYTLCYYNSRIKNTRAHQLAMAAVYYSPLQFMFWYDSPQQCQWGPELEFWNRIPTVFEESIALQGEPGEYIVQARRSGGTWYVGALNGLEERIISLDLNFLPDGKYNIKLFCDGATAKDVAVSEQTVKVPSKKALNLKLAASGGASMIINKK